jgi:hypothetical protein
MIIAVSITVFIVFFAAFASRALLSQASYQQRVITSKKDALKIAEKNQENAKKLEASYNSFATESINVLGGNPTGIGPLDGSNPKIVLDALPSVYDYPALSSSIEKLLLDNGYQIETIGGSEDAKLANDNTNETNKSSKTEVVAIPYPLSIQSTVDGTKNLLEILERSIRPFYVEKITISGSGNSVGSRITMKTYYQPGIGVEVTTKVVK